jgi:hypothetical protein
MVSTRADCGVPAGSVEIGARRQRAIEPMRIRVRLDGRQLRRWHVELIERLSERSDTQVWVDPGFEQPAVPSLVDSLFRIETLIHGLPREGRSNRAPLSALAGFARDAQAPADVALDLCGEQPCADGRVLRVEYDGAAGEAALLAAIFDRRTPLMQVRAAEGVIAAGRLGSDHGGIARATFEDMLARAATLILAALDGNASPVLPDLPPDPAATRHRAPLSVPGVAKIAAGQAARKIALEAYRLCCNAPHWRVGWRKSAGQDVYDLRRHPERGWSVLPDDGRRFYADPFPISYRGKLMLFLEDYEYRLGRGVISAVEFGPDGPIGAPIRVLEQPGHLSYPFVFEREGSLWMVPESCSAGTVDLYRSTDFPSGWVRESTLISGVVASDATLIERDGTWWLFATVRDSGGSFSDALHLWSAPDFRGPWTPHPRNPVLIDIASARPGGRLVERGGVLYRPVQDCRTGYGAAVGVARVVRLDHQQYRQTVEAILRPGPEWIGRRLHTLNSAGGFEFIDGSAPAPRWKAGR